MQAQETPSTEPTLRERARERAKARLSLIRTSRHLWPYDYPTFARDALTIRPKDPETGAVAGLRSLELNGVQFALEAALDNQLYDEGLVRAIIVKARQLGISTDVSGRFYWKVRYTPGVRALIMCHREDAARNILGMLKRFHEHDPVPLRVVRDNDTELMFENDSGFVVAVAGAASTGAGRAFTFQLAHLSELAFWQNASDHLTAVLDAVPDAPGSEIIIESTANGAAGPFYSMAMQAQRGQGSYQLLFLPWFEHEEYAREPPDDWVMGEAVRELASQHELADDKIYWAERKNADRAALDGDAPEELSWRFKQEYPSTIDEAFRAGRTGGYIAASVVARARARQNPHQGDMPLIFGCDFACGGGGGDFEHPSAMQSDDIEGSEDGDANVFIARRGRVLGKELYDRFRERDTIAVANRLQAHIDRQKPAMVFMDKGGGGAAVYDILCNRGYGRVLELVDFGSAAKPVDVRKYRNKRAEMWGDFREWLRDGDIPDDPELETEITAPWVHREDESGLVLSPKREIRKKLKLSPDGADAAATTFAAAVRIQQGTVRVGGGNRRRH